MKVACKEVVVELASVRAKIACKRNQLISPFWHAAVPVTTFAIYKIFDIDTMLIGIFLPIPIVVSIAVSANIFDNRAELHDLLIRNTELEAEVNFKHEHD
jgi:hypothetical protein